MLSERDLKDRSDIVRGLRDLANLIEAHGGEAFPLPYSIETTVSVGVSEYKNTAAEGEESKWESVYDTEATMKNLRKARRVIPGTKKKEFSDYRMAIIKEFSGNVKFTVYASRQAVCKKVPTGEIVVHAAQFIPERTEEKFEWVCEDPSLT
jgi:hypothetical protein